MKDNNLLLAKHCWADTFQERQLKCVTAGADA